MGKPLIVTCGYCRAVLNRHQATAGGTGPGDGDYTLCWACGSFSMYVDSGGVLSLREPNTAELAEIWAQPEAQALVAERSQGTDPRHVGRRLRRQQRARRHG